MHRQHAEMERRTLARRKGALLALFVFVKISSS